MSHVSVKRGNNVAKGNDFRFLYLFPRFPNSRNIATEVKCFREANTFFPFSLFGVVFAVATVDIAIFMFFSNILLSKQMLRARKNGEIWRMFLYLRGPLVFSQSSDSKV